MTSIPLQAPLPKCQKKNDMSFMFGEHMPVSDTGILFHGDSRIVLTPSNKIPIAQGTIPAWLVADWLLAVRRGEPISQYAQMVLNSPEHWNVALRWLQDFLN